MSDQQPNRDQERREIGVSFRHNPKVYSFVATGVRLSIGDKVLVRTERGMDMGEVMELRGRVDDARADKLMPVVRKATAEDLQHIAEQREREKQALETCAEAIEQHGLPMKLIDASMSFDNSRLVFFFSADGRVDFRELVRDLARTFRMRIELRQIGVRDEAKLLGGLGPCGRRLCCKSFMREFEPVGIRVAKDQGLALNPSKISGLCDRLMCCLLFEHQTYCALRRELPSRGDRVQTAQGPGTVKDVALLKEELHIVLDDGSDVHIRACQAGPLGSELPPQASAEAGPYGEAQAEPQPEAEPTSRSPAPEPMPTNEETTDRSRAPSEGRGRSGRRRRPRRRRSPGEDASPRGETKQGGQEPLSGNESDVERQHGSAGGAERQGQGVAQSGTDRPSQGGSGRSSGRRRGRRRPRGKRGGQSGQSGQDKAGGGGA